MKKLKILPSILMLVLCVGVLCMGIYAATPNSNQITGSITINPAGASIDVKVWTEDYQGNQTSTPQLFEGIRSGNQTITLNSGLEMDCSYPTPEEIKPVYVKVEIVNNSANKELGAYLSSKTMATMATKADILTEEPLAKNQKITATSQIFYKHLGLAANDTTDTALLTLEFKANARIDTSDPIAFDYFVNVEEYNPNMIGETLTDSSSGFIKIASTISSTGAQSLSTTTTPRTTISSTAGFRNLTTPADLWVVVPNGVTTIDGGSTETGAFYGCTALTRISLPNSLTTVENYGLYAGNITNLQIPESVVNYFLDSFAENIYKTVTENDIRYKGLDSKYQIAVEVVDKTKTAYELNSQCAEIAEGLFKDCVSLKTVTIPNNIKVLPNDLFNGCSALESLVVPEGVEVIGAGVFEGCKNLASLSLPNSLVKILPYGSDGWYSSPFKDCKASIYNGSYGVTSNGIKYIGNSTNKYLVCAGTSSSSLDSYVINSNTKIIGSRAFSLYSGQSVTIPSSVKYLMSDCFSGEMSLSIAGNYNFAADDAFINYGSMYSDISISYEESGDGYTYKDGVLTITEAMGDVVSRNWGDWLNPLVKKIVIPGSVIDISNLISTDSDPYGYEYGCRPAYGFVNVSQITVEKGDSTLKTASLPDYFRGCYLYWHLDEECTGPSYSSITDRDETVTYYRRFFDTA